MHPCVIFISATLSSNAGTFYQQLQFLSVDFISPKILQVNEAGTIHIGKERNMQWELNLISADNWIVKLSRGMLVGNLGCIKWRDD